MRGIFVLIFSVFLGLPCYSFDREESAVISLYEKINPAIVSVDSQLDDGLSCGTGCIIDKRGLILTSAHVVDNGEKVIVTMHNGQDYKAQVIKHLGENKDIALLKIADDLGLTVTQRLTQTVTTIATTTSTMGDLGVDTSNPKFVNAITRMTQAEAEAADSS